MARNRLALRAPPRTTGKSAGVAAVQLHPEPGRRAMRGEFKGSPLGSFSSLGVGRSSAIAMRSKPGYVKSGHSSQSHRTVSRRPDSAASGQSFPRVASVQDCFVAGRSSQWVDQPAGSSARRGNCYAPGLQVTACRSMLVMKDQSKRPRDGDIACRVQRTNVRKWSPRRWGAKAKPTGSSDRYRMSRFCCLADRHRRTAYKDQGWRHSSRVH